jgi:hypothetical protein
MKYSTEQQIKDFWKWFRNVRLNRFDWTNDYREYASCFYGTGWKATFDYSRYMQSIISNGFLHIITKEFPPERVMQCLGKMEE